MQDAAHLWKRTTPFTIVAKMLLDLGISYLSSLQVQLSKPGKRSFILNEYKYTLFQEAIVYVITKAKNKNLFA